MQRDTDKNKQRPALDRLHHISFVVADLDKAVARYEQLLGVPVAERGPVATRGAEVAIFRLANVNLEVVAPATEDSSLHAYLAEHGEGFFHIAFGVEDVDNAYQQLKAAGVAMQSEPYTAYKDWRISYMDETLPGDVRLHILPADSE